MSRSGEMNGNGQPDLRPKIRFPEFEQDGAWHTETIGEISEPIKEKVGEHKITPVSITAGVGFVPQADKFGRDISGEQYKNYTYLRRGDFAYNKGNSKSFPQGYVCQLHEFDEVAASSAFICFKLKDGYDPTFLKGLFDRNTHGRQLAAHITSGARSNGLLNLNSGQFYGVQLPFPPKFEEQERIAECLASIDALIEAETEKLDALKDHKQGLMQQLFPAEGESLPTLRFLEFSKLDGWETCSLDDLCAMRAGQFIRASEIQDAPTDDLYPCYGGNGLRGYVETYTHEGRFPLVGRQGALCGNVKLAEGQFHATEHAIVATPKRSVNVDWLFYLLDFMQLNKHATGQAQPGLSVGALEQLPAWKPCEREQIRIAGALSAADELIASQEAKVCSLQSHKLGLLQRLFPVLDEVDG